MPQTTSPIEFAFQLGLQRIQLQTEFFDALDQKTGMILGFVVVSIAELLGFLLLAAAEGLKASLLQESYLQVLPSRGDTFGLVLAEGMTFGKVVIASNKGGMKDWVKDKETGLIFNLDKENDLEEKIEYALTEDLTKIREHARKWVLQNLDIKVVAKRFEEIYKKLITV